MASVGTDYPCPYSIKDIIKAKNLTPEQIINDYQKLLDFDAENNPRKFCGNPIIYHFFLLELIRTKRHDKNWVSLEDMLHNPDLSKKIWKETIQRNRRKVVFPSPVDVYEAHRINKGAVVPFKASTAKYIYKKYNASRVLDPTMGWGGRMMGALSLNIDYIGMDTNTNLKSGYEEMKSLLDTNDKATLIFEDCLKQDFSQFNADLVLTSPPYANVELYSNMTAWKTDDDYYTEFLIPLMIKLFTECSNATLCINISPAMYKKLTKKFGMPEAQETEDLRQQLGQQYKTKSQDLIYIWRPYSCD